MAMFNSYVSLPEGRNLGFETLDVDHVPKKIHYLNSCLISSPTKTLISFILEAHTGSSILGGHGIKRKQPACPAGSTSSTCILLNCSAFASFHSCLAEPIFNPLSLDCSMSL